MKAITFKKYGLPKEVLELQETGDPIPKDDEVLIKVHATAINDYDWSVVSGKPYLYRLMFGLFKPKHSIPGMELAGVIEGLGSNVRNFKIGDSVYGDISSFGFGSFAEYIAINQGAIIKKPNKMSFEQAASISHASLLALQALQKNGDIKSGMNVLINGAGGGVGTFALQLVKLYNCQVTGIDTGKKLEMMKSIGFDNVIDYKKENFTKNGLKYDLILDCKSNKSPFSYFTSLKQNGKYVTVGGKLFSLVKILFWGKILSVFSSKKLLIISLKPNDGLDYINKLFEQNKIKCILDGPYSIEEIPRLLQYFEEGQHQGKVVIKMT